MPGAHPFSNRLLEQSGPGSKWVIPFCCLILVMGWTLACPAQSLPAPSIPLGTNETFVLIGAQSLASFHQPAYFETLLTAGHPPSELRFRDLTRDGDTTFLQPREINYPTPFQQAQKLHATFALIQFGQMESLAGSTSLPSFIQSLSNLVLHIQKTGARPILLTPLPFLPSPALTPQIIESRNLELQKWSASIVTLAQQLRLPSFDTFQNVMDSRQLLAWSNPQNRWSAAQLQHHLAVSLASRFRPTSSISTPRRTTPNPKLAQDSDQFSDPPLEQLRQLVLHKNKQWFHYSRPTNWAFLAGDRTEQLSSRDHINPKIRWFPAELEEFVPLIANAENAIRSHTQLHWGDVPSEKP